MPRNSLYILFLLLIITASLFPLFLGRFYAIGDIRDVYIPIEDFFHSELLAGRLPAWLPNAAWGFPVIASAQIGFFYPLLLLTRLLPLPIYLPLILILHLFATALGTFLLFRRLGRTLDASLLGAITFTLGGFVVLHLTHLNILLTLAWLPWQFLIIHKLTKAKSIPLRHLALIIISISFPFLAGQIHIPVLLSIVSIAWFIYLRFKIQAKLVSTISILLLIAVISSFVAAAQLLPTFELMLQSPRAPGSTFDANRANQHSYPVYHLPTLLFPRFFGNDDTYWGKRLQIEYGFYLGTIPLFLAISSLLVSKKRLKIKLAMSGSRFWLWMLIISWLLALGSLSPFRLLGFEPSLWFFSAPARWLLFSSFALSYFAAHGYDNLLEKRDYFIKLIPIYLFSLIFLIIIANLLLVFFGPTQLESMLGNTLEQKHITKLSSMLISARTSSASLLSPFTYLPILSLLGLWMVCKLKQPLHWLISITAIELLILSLTTTPTLPWSQILSAPSSISDLPAQILQQQARIYSVRDGGDTGAYFTNPDSRANAKTREEQRQLLVPLTHSQFNILSVEWPASLALANQIQSLENIRGQNGYEVINTDIAEQLNIGAILQTKQDRITITKLNPLPRIASIDQNDTETSLTFTSDAPNHLQITTSFESPTTLVVRDAWYPGWQAVIDAKPVPINKYDGIFRSIEVPAGEHSISMIYQPRLLFIGIIITCLTLIACTLSFTSTILNKGIHNS